VNLNINTSIVMLR